MLKIVEETASITITGNAAEIENVRQKILYPQPNIYFPKISMIKEIKNETGLGLVEAKRLAESLIKIIVDENSWMK